MSARSVVVEREPSPPLNAVWAASSSLAGAWPRGDLANNDAANAARPTSAFRVAFAIAVQARPPIVGQLLREAATLDDPFRRVRHAGPVWR